MNELLENDSGNKDAARLALGIDLTEWTGRIDAKADDAAIQCKADRSELGSRTQELENEIMKRGVPMGTVVMFTAVEPPAGYLKCDGSAVGRTTYPELYAAIGTTYGEGDGETTFNLQDLIGRFAESSATPGTVKEAGLPNITGTAVICQAFGVQVASGAFFKQVTLVMHIFLEQVLQIDTSN